MAAVGTVLALAVIVWLLPMLIWRAVGVARLAEKPECPHNVWGVDHEDKVVCLDCGRRVKWSSR
jgi:hypothetical protein